MAKPPKIAAAARRERQSLLLWLGAVLLLCALPFANRDLAAGHDALFHLLRIEGLAQALRGGAGWPQPVYALLCGGYGYAAGLFYPDVLLLPAALVRAAGVGPELAFKFAFLFYALLAALTAYAAGRGITRSHRGGLLLMVLYSLSQYHFANLFIRSALGEVQAMAFLPLVVWGLYDLTEQGFQKPWVLGAGFAGLLLTHTISLTLCGLFAVGWCLCRLPRLLHPRILARLAAAAGVCLLLGCYYWAPMLEQFGSDTFRVTTRPLTALRFNTVPLADYLNPGNYQAPGVTGFVLPLAAAALLLSARRRGSAAAGDRRLAAALLAAGVLLGLAPLAGVFPWQLLDKTFLTSVQFPWRLNMLSQFCLSLAVALPGAALLQPAKNAAAPGKDAAPARRWLPAAAVALAFGVSALGFGFQWGSLPALVNYPDNYFTSQRGETFYLVGQEWVPDGVDITAFAFEPDAQYTDVRGAHTGAYRPNGAFTFAFDGTPGLYGIPKLYYKGYTARWQGADGQSLTLPLHKDGAGRVELSVPAGLGAGTVTVRYTGTAVQHASAAVSLLTALGLAGWVFARRKKTTKDDASATQT